MKIIILGLPPAIALGFLIYVTIFWILESRREQDTVAKLKKRTKEQERLIMFNKAKTLFEGKIDKNEQDT